jgi:hypothetical protein
MWKSGTLPWGRGDECQGGADASRTGSTFTCRHGSTGDHRLRDWTTVGGRWPWRQGVLRDLIRAPGNGIAAGGPRDHTSAGGLDDFCCPSVRGTPLGTSPRRPSHRRDRRRTVHLLAQVSGGVNIARSSHVTGPGTIAHREGPPSRRRVVVDMGWCASATLASARRPSANSNFSDGLPLPLARGTVATASRPRACGAGFGGVSTLTIAVS